MSTIRERLIPQAPTNPSSVITVITSDASDNVQPPLKAKNDRKCGFRKGHAGYETRMHSRAVQEGGESLDGQLSRNVDKQVCGPCCLQYNIGNRLSMLLLRRASRGYLVLYIYNKN